LEVALKEDAEKEGIQMTELHLKKKKVKLEI
jgi:hypothetical protein